MFSTSEKKRRHDAMQQVVTAHGLQALLLIGDMNTGHGWHGDFRYYTHSRVNFERQIAIVFAGAPPILIVRSQFIIRGAREWSFMDDIRINPDYILGAVEALKERGVTKGKVGFNRLMMPLAWYEFLRKELPGIEWVDVHDAVMDVRLRHRSAEEGEAYRKCAELGVAGFEAALKMIRPGVTEYEIAAAIEYPSRKGGAEEHFTLIGSGKFAFGDTNTLPLPISPSRRVIQPGDTVVMEITPRYEGYWTQLVRYVDVGTPNRDLAKMQHVARDAITKGLELFKPGKRVKEVTAAMQSYIDAQGFVGKPPFGHICGIDLVEERVALENERVIEPGFVAIVHPMVHTKDGKNVIFWGQTYLATADGYERLHQATDDILTV